MQVSEQQIERFVTLAHDFGTSDSVITWIVNGYQLAIVTR